MALKSKPNLAKVFTPEFKIPTHSQSQDTLRRTSINNNHHNVRKEKLPQTPHDPVHQ